MFENNNEYLVLVIDDETIIRENIMAFLEDMDYSVIEAENGSVGIELFKEKRPDIVLVDLRMPEVGGLEVIKAISAIDAKTPIIVVSGTGLLQDAIDAIRLGAWDYLTKPIADMNAVLHVIKSSLEKSRLMHENELYRTNLENQVKSRTKDLEQEIQVRKHTEKKLRESEELFRSIVANIPGATFKMMLKDGKLKPIYFSDAIFNITGYMPDDFYSESTFLKDLLIDDDHIDMENQLLQAVEKKESYSRTYRIKNKKNIIIWVTEKGQGVFDAEGNLLFVAGSMFDVTLEKKAERDMKLALEKMEKADRLKTEFLANMSHEIRTPMTSIIGFSDLLFGTDLEEEQKTFLNVIKKASDHLLVIMNDIIDLSKIESDQIIINPVRFDLFDLFSEIRDFLKATTNNKPNIEFKIDFPEFGEIVLNTDVVRLKQLLLNLLSNSFKFTESGFVELNYKIVDNNIRFTIKDTGIGIPVSKREEIFEKFTQADASFTRKYGGVGLGLAISKRLSHYLGGDLKFNSVEGQGSEFYFSIPYREERINSDSQDENKNTKKLVNKGNSETILIVEDTKENILFLSAFLKKSNYSVIYAENGKEAIDMYKNHPEITLVLMDIQMPVMDGIEAIKVIREYEKDEGISKPVIALTAHAMMGDENRFLDAGFTDYVAKPFKINEILVKIEEYI